ncbi:MAG: choice-of-anchor B family protein [Bacteroidetes bacterium]|nr:choice-of-anchor B family protein [Bacteroidota bacterium]
MRRILLLASFVLAGAIFAPAQAQHLELIGTVDLPAIDTDTLETGGSDVWGYVAGDGSEYAIMGEIEGVSIVAVPSLEVVARIPGPTERARAYWRDIKTYGEYAYVVSEAYGHSEGLQIIDLSGLPARAEEVAVFRGENDELVSSHNLSIDTETGHAYVLNSNGSVVHIVSLADPVAPVIVGGLTVGDVHDVYARGDTVYVAEGRQPTFTVWNTADKASPELLARVTIPASGYVHNIWPTDDGRYVFTTEETAYKSVKVWDLIDLDNPTLVGEWLGVSRLAHNVLVQGDRAVVAHYTSGVYVLDISDVEHLTELAHHDTYARNDDVAMDGNWGATLPSPGGYIYASDQTGQLTVLRWTEGEEL